MSVTRSASIACVCLALSWSVHAEPPTVRSWSGSNAVIYSHAECREGVLTVYREPDGYGSTRTQLGYSLSDTCNDNATIASGNGLIANDLFTGSGKISLHLFGDVRTLMDVRSEGEPLYIDVTWEPIDGDFSVFRDSGSGMHEGVMYRSYSSSSTTAAKVTGTINLFEPTEAEMGWSQSRTIEGEE